MNGKKRLQRLYVLVPLLSGKWLFNGFGWACRKNMVMLLSRGRALNSFASLLQRRRFLLSTLANILIIAKFVPSIFAKKLCATKMWLQWNAAGFLFEKNVIAAVMRGCRPERQRLWKVLSDFLKQKGEKKEKCCLSGPVTEISLTCHRKYTL